MPVTFKSRPGFPINPDDVRPEYTTMEKPTHTPCTMDAINEIYKRNNRFNFNPDDIRPDCFPIKEPAPMTVDLSTLKVGDTVHLRDGTVSRVINVRPSIISDYPFRVTLDPVTGFELYPLNGMYYPNQESGLDIVAIIPLVVKVPMTVDLSVLKAGDNVNHRNGTVSSVTKVESAIGSEYPFCLTLNGHPDLGEVNYNQNGRYRVSRESGLDIVDIVTLKRLRQKPAIKLSELFFGTEAAPKEGKKSDSGKPAMALIPADILLDVAKVMTHGSKVYGKYNWTSGFEWTRLQSAAMRHIAQWSCGIDVDAESGESHLTHAICGLLMLAAHQKRGLGTDDRDKSANPRKA